MSDKLIFVVGTRPELIKVAPVIRALERAGKRDHIIVVNTAQHKDLLDPFWDIVEVKYDYMLDFMKAGQSLSELTSRAFSQLQDLVDKLIESGINPIGLMAQGDTTTVMVSSLVAFYNHIQFYHLEAGLRSHDLDNPFPEEVNRKVAGIVASTHFAPTESARQNLVAEGVSADKVMVVGNTVVDAVNHITEQASFKNSLSSIGALEGIENTDNLILVTCHRRENIGDNLSEIIEAIETLAKAHTELSFVWTVHPNPNMKKRVMESGLDELANVHIIPPMSYIDMLGVLSKARVAITDSGGVQEEAPSFNMPVLVLRETTERPESIDMGIGFLVGANKTKIIDRFERVLNEEFGMVENPYGDGQASIRIADFFIKFFK